MHSQDPLVGSRAHESKPVSGDWLGYAIGAITVCCAIVLIAALAIVRESRLYEERANTFTQNTVKLLSQDLAGSFHDVDASLQRIAFRYREEMATKNFDGFRFAAYMERELAQSKGLEGLRILDAGGVLRLSTGAPIPHLDLSSRDYFESQRKLPPGSMGKPMYFSEPFIGKITGTPIMVLSRRLEKTDGSFNGVVIAVMSTEVFGHLFSEVQMGPTGSIILRDEGLAQIDRFPRAKNLDQDLGNHKVSQKLVSMVRAQPQSGMYTATTNYDMVERYYSYARVGIYPFYIIAGVAVKDFLPSLGANRYTLPGFAILMVFLTILGFQRTYMLAHVRNRQRDEQQASLIVQSSPLPMFIFDRLDRIRIANRAACRLFGYPQDDLLGMSANELTRSQSQGESTPNPTNDSIEIVGLHKDGSAFPLKVARSAVGLDGGRHTIAVFEDLREQKRTEAQLHELLNLQSAILSHSAHGIITTNPSGVITLFNPACEKMLGYTSQEVVDLHTPIFFHAKHADGSLFSEQIHEHFAGVMRDVGRGGSKTEEFIFHRKDGSFFVASRSISALFDGDGSVTGFVAIVIDVTEMKEDQKRMAKLAHFDALTGLPNRTFFDQRLEHSMSLARRNRANLALLFLDLDKFKPINDTWGHAIGDLVLKEVAHRIAECLRESDSVGRLGGDEFLVLLPQITKPEDAQLVAEKIRHSLDQPMRIGGQDLRVSACIGVALFTKGTTTSAKLCEMADAAMYKAKNLGGNRVEVANQGNDDSEDVRLPMDQLPKNSR